LATLVIFKLTNSELMKRRHAERELVRSQDRMHSIDSASPIGIGVVSNRVIGQVNDQMCQMLGYTPDELVEKNAGFLYPTDEEYERVGTEKYAQIDETGIGTVETRWQCKDGRVLDILLRSSPIDRSDLTKGVTFTALDITARKTAELSLKESEEKLSQIVHGTHVPTFVIDNNHVITHWNRACENFTGFRAGEMVGTHNQWKPFYAKRRPVMADLIVDETIDEKIEEYYAGRYRTSTKIDASFEVIDFFPRIGRDGVWMLFSASALKDSQGNIIGAIETLQDISGLKRAEAELLQEKEKFRAILEQFPVGISLIAADGTYDYVNPKFVELFGYQLEDIPTRTHWFRKAFPDPQERARVTAAWAAGNRPSEAGKVHPRAFWTLCKNGHSKLIQFKPVTLNDGAQLVTYDDITDRHELERRFQQAQKHEAIGALAGGIAHDFNNILFWL